MDPVVPSPEGVCHFFQLPAELRNQIYGHVLSDAAGVVCREEFHNGSGLFRFYPHAIVDKNLPSERMSSEDENLERILDGRTTSRSVPLEINQLKYVCRQLNFETKTIVVRINDLIFERGAYPLSRFLDAIPVAMQKHLQKVIVLENRKWSLCTGMLFLLEEPWQNVLGYSRARSAFTAHVHLSWLKPKCISIMLFIAAMSLCTRRQILIDASRSALPHFVHTFNSWTDGGIPDVHVSSNIRFFPPDTDSEEGLYGCTRGYYRHACVAPTDKDLEVIKHVVENGLYRSRIVVSHTGVWYHWALREYTAGI